MARVYDIHNALDELAPVQLAESWDNVGLLIGNAQDEVSTILVALDATPDVLDQAAEHQATVLVTHHPLIFSGIKRLVSDLGTTGLALRMVREGRNLLSFHTNLDSAPDGLNAYVADLLGLHSVKPMLPNAERPFLKLVVYVPETHVDQVREAICQAGAGHIGNYSECTFGVEGTGTFKPEEGTSPYLGTVGELERVHEIRLETVVPKGAAGRVIDAMLQNHPYEEVAYDLFSLKNTWPGAGLGRVGTLESPVTMQEFCDRVRAVLKTDWLMTIGDPGRLVQRIALCTGAGGDYADAAYHTEADLYLTGEIKHHQALLAHQRGLSIIAAGHFATERPAVPLLADYLQWHFPELTVIQAQESDPIHA